MKTDFRERRASPDSHHFCASLNNEEITVWGTREFNKIATMRPGFSGGRERYIVDPLDHIIYSGTWENGLTAFDYMSEKQQWKRKDLIGIQRVDLSPAFPTTIFVTLEAPDYRVEEPGIFSGIVELERKTGKTVWKSDKGDDVYLHPDRPILVVQDRVEDRIRILNERREETASTEMLNFALIDLAFSGELIALAEGAKGTRVLDTSGKTISRNIPAGRKPNCTRVAIFRDHVCVYDSWENSFITIIDPKSGKTVSEYKMETGGDPCFIDNGARFFRR
ncbi:MAG: hypothetical protein ACJAQT_004200 [Akkermansiaceae bacterium]|jgi:hypothetical protein